jgi:GNAT superfamily N-acetyltransferase
MSIELRRAEPRDKSRCLELIGTLAGRPPDPAWGDVFDRLLKPERGEIVVADEAGELLGVATVSYNLAIRYSGEYCQLEELIVDPNARGRNVGGLLVQETLRRARDRGCAEYGLYLVERTENNRLFYEKYGLRVVGSEMRTDLRNP